MPTTSSMAPGGARWRHSAPCGERRPDQNIGLAPRGLADQRWRWMLYAGDAQHGRNPTCRIEGIASGDPYLARSREFAELRLVQLRNRARPGDRKLPERNGRAE